MFFFQKFLKNDSESFVTDPIKIVMAPGRLKLWCILN